MKHENLRIANDASTALDKLKELSNSEHFFVRGAVAFNPSTPEEALSILSRDSNSFVLECLELRSVEKSTPKLVKINYLTGKNLRLRNVCVGDADFIISLRTDTKKSRFISKTSNDISLQQEWLREYAKDDSQIYFIIEDLDGDPLGTIRIYDAIGVSFCWGSWILKDNLNPFISIESAVMVYSYASYLGFLMAHFDVRKDNHSVNKFHQKMGASLVFESETDNEYIVSHSVIKAFLKKYKKFTPLDLPKY